MGNLNDELNNLKITSIVGILEKDIDKCLTIIKMKNPSTDIKVVNYDASTNTLNLYADNYLQIQGWYDSLNSNDLFLHTRKDILKEIQRINAHPRRINLDLYYNNTDDLDDDISPTSDFSSYTVSLDEVFSMLKMKYLSFQREIIPFIQGISNILKNIIGYKDAIICGFDYNAKTLRISVKDKVNYENINIRLLEDKTLDIEGNLRKPESKQLNDIFEESLRDLIQIYMQYEYYKKYSSQVIPSVNSRFYIYIRPYQVELDTIPGEINENDFFYLTRQVTDGKYFANSSDKRIIDDIKDKEYLIFKSVQMRISDCPLWMQQDLINLVRETILRNKENDNKETSLKLNRKEKDSIKLDIKS